MAGGDLGPTGTGLQDESFGTQDGTPLEPQLPPHHCSKKPAVAAPG